MYIQGEKNIWELVIGLEIHAQLKTQSKLFSKSKIDFGKESNTSVSFFDIASPGELPIINQKCVELAVMAGLSINGKINNRSVFDRKNYFYPDLPQGYQISQFYEPIVENGYLDIEDSDKKKLKININRIHLEQDAGKSIHDQSPDSTFIDLNRVGVALIEIVTEPDFKCPRDVEAFLRKLRNILRYCDICNGDLEKGSMRCDANVSVRLKDTQELGTRVEIKNLNSFKNINKAIISEAERQVSLLENGKDITQETRLYDVNKNVTRSMRNKEEAQDYRYFPDPDLLPLHIENAYIEKIRQQMPELPEQKKNRYVESFKITEYDADVITADKEVALFFEKVALNIDPKLAANWLCAELFGRLNKKELSFSQLPISCQNFISLLKLIEAETLSGKIAKEVLDKMFETNQDPNSIVEKHGLRQISDKGEITEFVKKVLNANKEKVLAYKNGKDKLFGFFIGQVMSLSKGKVNPNALNEILRGELKE